MFELDDKYGLRYDASILFFVNEAHASHIVLHKDPPNCKIVFFIERGNDTRQYLLEPIPCFPFKSLLTCNFVHTCYEVNGATLRPNTSSGV